jgi:hypothetical protein
MMRSVPGTLRYAVLVRVTQYMQVRRRRKWYEEMLGRE